MKNSIQKTPVVFALIFFFICAGIFLFLYKVTVDKAAKTQEEKIAWKNEAERRDDIRTLDQTLQAIAPERAKLDTHFAKTSDVVPFLDTLEKLAPSVGADAAVTSVEALPKNAGITVGLKASGSFSSLYKFLMLLENSPYELDFLAMDIHKVAMTGTQGLGWEATFKIQLLSFVP